MFIENVVSVDRMHDAIRSLGYLPTTVSSAINANEKLNSKEIPEPVRSALTEAQAQGKLLFIDFQAEWCGACKIMDKTTFTDLNVQNTLKSYVFLKVDADDDAAATNHYGVAGLPTLVVMNGNGEEVYRHVGPISAEDLNLVLLELRGS